MRFLSGVLAILWLALLATIASASDFIQMDFDGVVTQGGPTTGVTLVTGDTLHARVVFDADAPDTDPSPLHGRYRLGFMEVFSNRGPVFITEPGLGTGNGIDITRSTTFDEFRFQGYRGFHDDSVVFVRFPPGTFADDTLPVDLPFMMATQAEFVFYFIAQPWARASFTEYRASVVPEPSTTNAAVVIAALAAKRRRRC